MRSFLTGHPSSDVARSAGRRMVGSAAVASIFLFVLGGCGVSPEGITGPCPEPPAISPMPDVQGDEDWFATTAEIVNDYAVQLVGFDEKAAEACVSSAGLTWRVIARDGEYFAVTLDYSPQRVNVVIEDSIVQEASSG